MPSGMYAHSVRQCSSTCSSPPSHTYSVCGSPPTPLPPQYTPPSLPHGIGSHGPQSAGHASHVSSRSHVVSPHVGGLAVVDSPPPSSSGAALDSSPGSGVVASVALGSGGAAV